MLIWSRHWTLHFIFQYLCPWVNQISGILRVSPFNWIMDCEACSFSVPEYWMFWDSSRFVIYLDSGLWRMPIFDSRVTGYIIDNTWITHWRIHRMQYTPHAMYVMNMDTIHTCSIPVWLDISWITPGLQIGAQWQYTPHVRHENGYYYM